MKRSTDVRKNGAHVKGPFMKTASVIAVRSHRNLLEKLAKEFQLPTKYTGILYSTAVDTRAA